MTNSSSFSTTPLLNRFTAEWFWVCGYGIVSVIVVVLNVLSLCSIYKNAFLRTNTHRALAVVAFRNVLRVVFSLVVVYISRWSYSIRGWKYASINSTKQAFPLLCDILCTIDTFLVALPMFMMVALAVHMFTRFPSPQLGTNSFKKFPFLSPHTNTNLKVYGQQLNSLNTGFLPREPLWLAFVLPGIPILMAAVVSSPIPILHLTHALQVYSHTYTHLTVDISVFILQFCLPFLLISFLIIGLIVRRCLQCSSRHCCNSWCKEEAILVCYFVLMATAHSLLYLTIFEEFAKKLKVSDATIIIRQWIKPEIARAIETVTGGIALPVLCYLILPSYRQFCSEPDPDDLKLSVPDGHESVIMTGMTSSHTDLLPSHPTTPGPQHKHMEPQHPFSGILTSGSFHSKQSKRFDNDGDHDI